MIERYDKYIIITSKLGAITIFFFVMFQRMLYAHRGIKIARKIRMILATASILEDVTSAVVNTQIHPPPDKFLII